MKVLEFAQRGPEWYEARRGVPSASCFDMILTIDGSPSKQSEKYMHKLACERVSGICEETFQSAAMASGVEREDEARSVFEAVMGVEVEQVGLCVYEGDFKVVCSPDGLYNKRKLGLEIKCPIGSTIVKYILNKDALIKEYWQQVQGSIFVTGADGWSLMGYYQGISKSPIIEIEPDKKYQACLEVELRKFCEELENTIKKIK